jgi:RNA polymerase sigma factor (sigma-70 family)
MSHAGGRRRCGGVISLRTGAQRHAVLPPFQWLLDEYAGLVLRFLTARVGPVDAEDCFQETMIAAMRAYPELAHGSNLRGWLLTIAQRKAVDNRRQAQRRPLAIDGASIDLAATVDAPLNDPTGSLTDQGLWDRVRRLPRKQRSAVALRYAEDRSYPDIARAMATSEAAARRNVHEGIKKLRREVQ